MAHGTYPETVTKPSLRLSIVLPSPPSTWTCGDFPLLLMGIFYRPLTLGMAFAAEGNGGYGGASYLEQRWKSSMFPVPFAQTFPVKLGTGEM